MRSKRGDRFTKTVNDLFQRCEYFILETAFSYFFPDLFYRIHFWSIGWNEMEKDIGRNIECVGFVLGGTVTTKHYNVIGIFFGKFP